MRPEIENVLSVARTLPSAELPAFIGQISEVHAVALARLTSPSPVEPSHDRDGDDVLNVKEAADFIGMSAKWVYKHSDILPHIAIGFGATPRLKFRRKDLSSWLERRLIEPRKARK